MSTKRLGPELKHNQVSSTTVIISFKFLTAVEAWACLALLPSTCRCESPLILFMQTFDYPAFLVGACHILLFHHSVESGKHCCMNDDQISAEEPFCPLSHPNA